MRRKLALGLGSSLATLAALTAAGPARAATTVSGGSTAVATSTAASGSADDVVQTGTLSVASGAAITLDSNNSVTNSGTIQLQNLSGVTGIEVLGGHAGAVINSGTITLNESASTTTTDSSGNVIGPFATGSNRYGIRVQGPGTFIGDITNSGTLTVQGEDSAGVSVETTQTGNLVNAGTITVTGSRAYGSHTTAPVSGSVTLTGAVTAAGADAQAVAIGGDVGGGLVIESAVSATGYHTTTRSSTTSVLADQNLNDAALGGPAVSVAGRLGSGLLVSAPPAVISTEVADTDGDGVADATETTASVTSYGSAPAIQLGATVGHDIALGVVGTGDSAYGLVIGGAVSGLGLRDGVAATGLQIGVADGGAVTISQGVRVRGTITATAYGGDAVGLHLYGGASTPLLYNSGTISAGMTGEGAQSAQAIVIESGASLPTISNAGSIRGAVLGSAGDAAAIIDRSGTLTHIENIGVISATTTAASGSTTTPSGKTIAIDVSANTTGFSLRNYLPSGWSITPTIVGSVLMGSGADSIDISAGSITGDLSFGAGANALTIDGGATVTGGLTADGGTLALSVGSGTLQVNSASQVNLTSLSLGAGSTVVFTADPAAAAATRFDVAGGATIASGAKIDVKLISFAQGSTTYTLIRADQLSASDIDISLLGTSPYIYGSSLSVDTTAGTVDVTLSRKTATELTLPAAIAQGYEPVIAAAAGSATLAAAVLAQTDRAGFIAAYNQLLPEHSGGVFRMISTGVEAFGRPLDDRQGDGSGGWLQEVNYATMADTQGDLLGYKSWGIGLVGGYELPPTRAGVFGATLGGLSAELRPRETGASTQVNANLVEAGGYWRARRGPFTVNARLAGDYMMATSHRAVDIANSDATLFSGTSTGHWTGWGVTSRLRASYEQHWRSLYLRPQLGLDYLQLHEDGYQEGGDEVLDLTVQARKTSELTSFAGVALGAMVGDETAFWSPEILLGYRNVLSAAGGSTTAAFNSGAAFTVGPVPTGDQGFVARLALKSESGPVAFSLEGGAETRDGVKTFDAKLAAHFQF